MMTVVVVMDDDSGGGSGLLLVVVEATIAILLCNIHEWPLIQPNSSRGSMIITCW